MGMTANRADEILLAYIRTVKKCLDKVSKIVEDPNYDINRIIPFLNDEIIYDASTISSYVFQSSLKANQKIALEQWYTKVLGLKSGIILARNEGKIKNFVMDVDIHEIEQYLEQHLGAK